MKKDKFVGHLEQRLAEIKEKCEEGTIDAIILGGKDPSRKYVREVISKPNLDYIQKEQFLAMKQNYLDSIKLLSEKVEKFLGFHPVMINGPKTEKGYDNLYYDNKNRRVHFMRSTINSNVGSFVYSEIEEEKKKWEK